MAQTLFSATGAYQRPKQMKMSNFMELIFHKGNFEYENTFEEISR